MLVIVSETADVVYIQVQYDAVRFELIEKSALLREFAMEKELCG